MDSYHLHMWLRAAQKERRVIRIVLSGGTTYQGLVVGIDEVGPSVVVELANYNLSGSQGEPYNQYETVVLNPTYVASIALRRKSP